MNLSAKAAFISVLVLLCLNSSGRQTISDTFFKKSSIEGYQQDPLKSEFRGVWVATVNNIDWPSKPGLPVEEQKREFLKLLESFQLFNLNVVILQVRAASDAFYRSKTEPWSYFLTGKQGKAPQPFFDPLAWAIEMCHLRGMELHAWFNPFRVRNNGYYQLDPNSYAAKHPQYVREFDKKMFLDPGYPEVREHVAEVIAEVAINYEVDAIILDDYFYPYPVQGKRFGDEKSFAKYGGAYYPKRLKDWRRNNINQFIELLHETIHGINPKIKFGISPFGIWRNKAADPAGSAGLRGLSSYDDLYADVRKWLINGWIDYVIPQLYWEKGNHFGDFTSLVKWWSDNSYGKSLYIGQALYKSTTQKNGWRKPNELYDQINFLRKNEKVRGFAFYSASNIAELSVSQVRNLRENHLNTIAEIDDNRRSPDTGEPSIQGMSGVPGKAVMKSDSFKKEFRASLVSQQVYSREMRSHLSGVLPVLKRMKRYRVISWNLRPDTISHMVALVIYKKTGKNNYIQEIGGMAGSARFILPDSKWKELKDSKVIMVSRDVRNNSDHYSTFFELKRRKIKPIPNPFSTN